MTGIVSLGPRSAGWAVRAALPEPLRHAAHVLRADPYRPSEVLVVVDRSVEMPSPVVWATITVRSDRTLAARVRVDGKDVFYVEALTAAGAASLIAAAHPDYEEEAP
jgi:hypothetical protein